MRYLTDVEILALTNLGKVAEMFIGQSANQEIIEWVDLYKKADGSIEVNTHKVFDEGSIDNLDIYSFSSADPDEPYTSETFSTIEEALKQIRVKYKLTDLRFLNQFVIQDEYRKLKERENI